MVDGAVEDGHGLQRATLKREKEHQDVDNAILTLFFSYSLKDGRDGEERLVLLLGVIEHVVAPAGGDLFGMPWKRAKGK